ncbi:MAG TPA: aconitate hydratase AcnA [Bdellovibrionota bacterium]|nr:aconitate hydratase AcnA [Bdellovibrionota bacterium]
MLKSKDSFGARSTIKVGQRSFEIFRLSALENKSLRLSALPFSLKILLENLLRNENGVSITADDVEALCRWDPTATPSKEIAFVPARVLLQDFTGVPVVVDLAAMRDAIQRMGGDPGKINPLQPVELVIDHSVQVDMFGSAGALAQNSKIEFDRNQERYGFLRWGQKAFQNFRVVPPSTGIVHQVNLEYLARVVMAAEDGGRASLYPDTVVGTDSHTTMINGLGVLGWGVGGIEAEAAMLGQPVSMLIPQVVEFRLTGRLPEGATATDAVLRVTEMLRKKNVVGKFVEFCGPGLAELPLADRATIANMAPEYGATCGIFPVDRNTLEYLRLTGRSNEDVGRVEAYMKEQQLFETGNHPDVRFSDTVELDLGTVEASLAGPKRPQDRVTLKNVKKSFLSALAEFDKLKTVPEDGEVGNGSVVIAAITSCTNTSNPSVMMGAGILARKAVERGLRSKPWVKTSLAPGSKTVTDYLKDAELLKPLETLNFHVVGYGCTTCIGNSGPLPPEISKTIERSNLLAVSVLSGNRNFEGRVHPEVRANYLASPPLVVAYALVGRIDVDLTKEPIGTDTKGKPVYLREIWPTQKEVQEAIGRSVRSEMFRKSYESVFEGDKNWQSIPAPAGDTFQWDKISTYVKHPPYFEGFSRTPKAVEDIVEARVLALLGDSVTTDHISPAGSIQPNSPAGLYLRTQGVDVKDFNSYGSRRGNHEVMMRGTFANVRLRNRLVPGVEGGMTFHLPDKTQMSIYDAAMKYQAENVPLIILAGKEYGSGSSRDWAAKGVALLGVKAVIAESFERIHRSNLIGMGVLPLEFKPGESFSKLELTGLERFTVAELKELLDQKHRSDLELAVHYKKENGQEGVFNTRVRLDTPQEVAYYQHGGILPFVLRQLLRD